MGKKHLKTFAARHGRGTAWAWHVMCESAFTVQGRRQRVGATVKRKTKEAKKTAS
jgi:hypothetical protein